YRLPLVLCDLEGRTAKDAARQLGLPQGTVAGRLARARDLLAGRLARRGVTLSAGVLAAVLGPSATAALPPALVGSTLRAAAVLAGSFGDGILATSSLDETVRLWDADTSEELAAFSPVPKTVDPDNIPVGLGWVQFRTDGKRLAIGSRESGGVVFRDFSEKR